MKHTPIASRMESGAARSAPTPTLRGAPQSILATAREQVEQELGPRPSITSVGSWTGYRTNSDEQECAAFVGHLSKLAAMRRWDRAVSDRCKLLGMAPTLIGDA